MSFDVKKVAELARIAVSDDEAREMEQGFESILNYINEIQSVDVSHVMQNAERPLLRNVVREDTSPYPAGTFTETLLAEAPHREGDYIRVKRMIGGQDHS